MAKIVGLLIGVINKNPTRAPETVPINRNTPFLAVSCRLGLMIIKGAQVAQNGWPPISNQPINVDRPAATVLLTAYMVTGEFQEKCGFCTAFFVTAGVSVNVAALTGCRLIAAKIKAMTITNKPATRVAATAPTKVSEPIPGSKIISQMSKKDACMARCVP